MNDADTGVGTLRSAMIAASPALPQVHWKV